MADERGFEVADGPLSTDLDAGQQAWARRSEKLWRRAHDIARRHPGTDVSDIFHALRCLALAPGRRLAAGLTRGRLRPHSR